MPANKIRETDLYPAVKELLEGQGYAVKGEIGDADVVGFREGEDPIIVELKTGFSLALFHQAIARQAFTDAVYIAVPRRKGRPFFRSLKNNRALCRRLGLGLITVRLKDGHTEIHLDPAPYKPRKSKHRKGRLLREFSRRVGDTTDGGTRHGVVTAYRQDALRCLKLLAVRGPTKASKVAAAINVENARRIMADNHYGWFERIQIGVYAITPAGRQATEDYAGELAKLE